MSKPNRTPNRVDVLENLTKVHFSDSQRAEVDLAGYFNTLRDIGWNINDNVNLMDVSETIRDLLWEHSKWEKVND